MKKRIPVSVALAVTLIAMTVTFAITMLVSMDYFNNAVRSVTQMQAQYSKLADLDSYVRGNYFGDIDDAQLNDRIAQGYLAGVGDKYSVYYTEKEFAELQEFEQGTRVDIGAVINLDADGYFRIVRVFADSPAAKGGVEAGGRILAVDGVDAKTLTGVKGMTSLLRGLQGTELELTCLVGTEEVSYKIQRTNYVLPTVEYQKAGDFGYLRIYGFEKNTFAEFERRLEQAQADGVKGIVFDVRGNSGNVYESAYDILNLLCPRGVLAKSESKNGTVKVLRTSNEDGLGLPMAVLVDGNTAAAAEVFATAVRDLAGGQVAGVSTAGKWMLQSLPQRLPDGSAVSITTAKLLSGNDENFEGAGIAPDVGLEAMVTTEGESHLWNPDPENDTWILRALDVVRGMAVSGGSGELEILQPDSSASQSAPDPAASGSEAPADTGEGGEPPPADPEG